MSDESSEISEEAEIADLETEEVSEELSEELIDTEEIIDPLQKALDRAEKAEQELAYRDASIDTLRRKIASERSEAYQQGVISLARRFVVIVEDLERALKVTSDASEAVNEGLQRVFEKTLGQLEIVGIKRIETVGNTFDPLRHEAIMTVPATEEFSSGIIAGETEAGWVLNTHVIRAARVVVSSDSVTE